jgi:hypothetical protein
MAREERARWLELLSYVNALIYHEREETEREDLQGMIVRSALTPEDQQEIEEMHRTMAQADRERAALQTKREVLLRQLRQRFGDVPPATEQLVGATDDGACLDQWLDRVVTADSVEEVGIAASRRKRK